MVVGCVLASGIAAAACGADVGGEELPPDCEGASCNNPSTGSGSSASGTGAAAGFDPTGSGTGGKGTGGQGGACAEAQVEFEQQIPTVVLLVDQSGSMTAGFGGMTRWQAVSAALLDASTGVVPKLQQSVRFGMTLYTSKDGFKGGTCPMLKEVAPALDNLPAMSQLYAANKPIEDTPTGESLMPVADALAAYPEPGPKVIVLVTDGEPDTCAVPDPQNGQAQAIAGAEYAFGKGIEVYIISVGNEVGKQHQQQMANAGVGLPPSGPMNAPYYQADNPAQLVSHFETIINGVRPCAFTLKGSVDPAHAGEGQVLLDGKPLAYGDPDGWKLNGTSEVELVGAACDAIQTGDHSLDIEFPCGVFTPLPK
jgi:hypothetical protein